MAGGAGRRSAANHAANAGARTPLVLVADPWQIRFEETGALGSRCVSKAKGWHLADQARSASNYLITDPMKGPLSPPGCLTLTNRIVGGVTALAITAASIVSFLLDFT